MQNTDSLHTFYPLGNYRAVPINCQQADSVYVPKPQVEYTTSMFSNHLLSLKSEMKLIDTKPTIPTWFFLYLLVTLLITSIISQLYRKRFRVTINALWQNRFYNQISNESGLFDHALNMIFFLLYASNLSFVLVLAIHYFVPALFQDMNIYFMFLIAMITIILISILKTFVSILTAKLFKQESFRQIYITQLHLSENNVGLYLLPIGWLALYHPGQIIFTISVFILLIYSAVRFIKLIYNLSISTRLSSYQIFLYLCTVEILPLIVLLKFFALKL